MTTADRPQFVAPEFAQHGGEAPVICPASFRTRRSLPPAMACTSQPKRRQRSRSRALCRAPRTDSTLGGPITGSGECAGRVRRPSPQWLRSLAAPRSLSQPWASPFLTSLAPPVGPGARDGWRAPTGTESSKGAAGWDGNSPFWSRLRRSCEISRSSSAGRLETDIKTVDSQRAPLQRSHLNAIV